jgi:hypothetical protein
VAFRSMQAKWQFVEDDEEINNRARCFRSGEAGCAPSPPTPLPHLSQI